MYAHVTTHHLGSEDEVNAELASDLVINDQTARTIASWWHSSAETSRNITCLSHGLPFDTDGLAEEIDREISDPDHQRALSAWLDQLVQHLST